MSNKLYGGSDYSEKTSLSGNEYITINDNGTLKRVKISSFASTTDNNYTTADKNKLAGIATGAEVNVQSDWSENDNNSDAYILNKPTLGNSASLNTGTTANTVALGNDSRFVIPSSANTSPNANNIPIADANKTVDSWITRNIEVLISDPNGDSLTIGDGKAYFAMPPEFNGWSLVDCDGVVTTVSSSGLPTIQIRNVTKAVDMLSTRITIDASENSSYTASTPPVIDDTNKSVSTGDIIAIDVDASGTGTKGLIIILSFRK